LVSIGVPLRWRIPPSRVGAGLRPAPTLLACRPVVWWVGKARLGPTIAPRVRCGWSHGASRGAAHSFPPCGGRSGWGGSSTSDVGSIPPS
jgi:hypothetical protein